MTMAQGDDYVIGYVYPFEQANRIKNAFRQADPKTNVSNAQPGMRLSDSNDNRLWHVVMIQGVKSFLEILQGDIICLENEVVCFNNEVLMSPKT